MTRLLNLFDRRYYTAPQLATTGPTAQSTFVARAFPANATGDFPLQCATTGFAAQATFIARPFPANATGDFPLQCATPDSPCRARSSPSPSQVTGKATSRCSATTGFTAQATTPRCDRVRKGILPASYPLIREDGEDR